MNCEKDYRSLFPICDKYAFLNHAAVSAPSIRVLEALRTLHDEFTYEGLSIYEKWMEQVEEARSLFARLINAAPDEIAFVQNTSEGLGAIATGLNWKEGDAVLVPRPDFPSNIYPWMNLERSGVLVRFYERKEGRFGPKEVEEALVPGTRLLTVSSVDFVSGYYCDLEELGDFCRRKGILFCVDAIQSLGVIPMDVKKFGIHFLASGGHKWLLSTMGQGALYISKEANDLVHPSVVGWKSVADEEDFYNIRLDLKKDALRFEPGTMNVSGIVALGAAVGLLLDVGIEEVRKRVFSVNDLFYEGLRERGLRVVTPMGEGERSGILSFMPSSDAAALNRYLSEHNVKISLRGDKIRLSPHFYNNSDDVEAFFRALDSFQKSCLS